MFQTQVGAMEDASSTAYLRPETAQGIFINFKNVAQLARRKPPFGIAQVGKSFRNEITPGNFLFRVREFEQMEMEYFVPPDEAERWYAYWIEQRLQWYLDLGLASLAAARARAFGRRSGRTTRAGRATSSTSTRSAGRSSRASRTAATSISRSTRSTPERSSNGSGRRASATRRT